MADDLVWDTMTSSWMTEDEWHKQNDARYEQWAVARKERQS